MARFLAVSTALLLALSAFAGAPEYHASREATISGPVLYLGDEPSGAAWAGVYVIMKDGQNEIAIYLGPSSFLAKEGLQLHMQDSVKILGSRTQWSGSEIILARQVTAGHKTVILRNEQGEPRW